MATADDMVEAIKQLNLSVNVLVHEQRRNTEEVKKSNKGSNQNSGGKGGSTMGDLLGNYRNLTGGLRGAGSQFAGGNLAGGLQSIVQSGKSIEGVSSGITSAMGGGRLAAAAGPVGAAVVATVGITMALNEFKKALDAATQSTIAHYRQLGQYSSQMALNVALHDIQKMMREREKGDRLAPVAAELMQAEQQREDAGKEVEIAWEEFKAGFLIEFQKTMRDILMMGSDAVAVIKQYFGGSERIDPAPHLGAMLQQQADKLQKAKQQQRQQQQQPNRPNGF